MIDLHETSTSTVLTTTVLYYVESTNILMKGFEFNLVGTSTNTSTVLLQCTSSSLALIIVLQNVTTQHVRLVVYYFNFP